MADGMFDGAGLDLIKKGLDAYALRQRVIAANIAHVETPGYRARSVAFEDLLQRARRLGAEELPDAEVRASSSRALDNGINDVSIDQEMAALAETNLRHKLATRILARRYQQLRAAISGRSSR